MSAKQIFEKFDKNKNGKLSLDEFRDAVLAFSLNISEKEVTQMFKEIDVDGDGELSSEEFASSVDKMLKEAFALCDADGDGKITSSECRRWITSLYKAHHITGPSPTRSIKLSRLSG
ncbi:probable calcium-binding protein CML34 [Brassica napus]|uniref:probable calcium-binding protein CML34 n=1 Tax=Brassica napus TaxID=3708 RepID=UPI00207901C3|nr:probable calcium-binding protein CML34 [Brassica napus]